MPLQFAKPPLVELIAEVRWGAVAQTSPLQLSPVILALGAPNNQSEEFFMRLGGKLSAAGFTGVERVMPFGMPFIPFQPIYRFKDGAKDGTTLFQAGTNAFTVNTTPPYKSWNQFRPLIEKGIGALIETRPDPASPFFFVSVRYIDLFKEDLTGGRSIGRFVQEVLGIELRLPTVALEFLAPGGEVRPHLNLTIPLKNGMTMTLNLLEGSVKGERGVVMDTVVSSTSKPITPEIEAVMSALDAAHDAINTIFIGLTAKIHAAMEPIPGALH